MPCSRAAAVSSSITSSPDTESSDPVGSSANSTSRPGDQAAGQRDALRLPAGQLPGPAAAQARPGRARRTTSWPPSSPGRGGYRTAARAGRRSLPRSARGPAARTGTRTRTGPGAARCAGHRPGCPAAARRTTPPPAPGTKMPARQCSKVDLPDPLGPMTATISPCRTAQRGTAQRRRFAERLHQVPRLDDLRSSGGGRDGGEVRGHWRTARASRSSRAAVWSIHRRSASRR